MARQCHSRSTSVSLPVSSASWVTEEIHRWSGTVCRVQEAGQQVVSEKGLGNGEPLGGEGTVLPLAQSQARLGSFEQDFHGPAARIFCTTPGAPD